MLTVATDIIVIGGGASGLMAAWAAAREGAAVTVLEKMPRPARKLMITGKGRCNFTNVKPWDEFSRHIRTKSNFLRPAFYSFSPRNTLDFMEDNRLEVVVERGDRAFPASHRSVDVIDTLVSAVRRAGVVIETLSEVTDVVRDPSGEGYMLSCRGGRTYSCRRLIVATGGLSYPATGSTGDGYRWARQAGHSIVECFPSLTAMVPRGYKLAGSPDPLLKGHVDRTRPLSEAGRELCGVHLRNVSMTLYVNGNKVQEAVGEMDFTDGGIEGPIGFELSRSCVKAILNGGKCVLSLDLKAGVDEAELSGRIAALEKEIAADSRSRSASASARYKVLLGKLMPREVIPAFMRAFPPSTSKNLSYNLKHWSFVVEGYVGYERAVVTAGGVSTDEVLPKTMESRLRSGLYFCGEVLDIDSDTGGYNIQTAFSTGYLAGVSAARSL